MRSRYRSDAPAVRDHTTRHRTVLAVGHFPPPVHGMAVAVDKFAALVEEVATVEGGAVRRLNINAPRAKARAARHCVRVIRVLRACAAILFGSRGNRVVYVSVDAGIGMSYTLLVTVAARARGTPVFLHHHAADYLRQRTIRFRMVCRVSSATVCHLVGCDDMRRSLLKNYPRVRASEVVPIEYAVGGGPQAGRLERAGTGPTGPLVLGHLSNLRVDKGLEIVFDTAEAIRNEGIDCEIVIAGPPDSESDQMVLERRLDEFGPAARYLGPVRESARERFFESVDVFLFPSRYRHESFGLVVGEALVRGCPVIAYENACLTSQLAGAAGLILRESHDFVELAREWIVRFCRDERGAASAVGAALDFYHKRDEALVKARAVASQILHEADPPRKGGRVGRAG